MVSSSLKASSKEMERNALIGVDKLPEKIYKTLNESTKILIFKVPFPILTAFETVHLQNCCCHRRRHLYDSKGKEVDLNTYKGKVLLVVNVASKCMEGPLSNQGLTSFRHLQILDLSENNFFAISQLYGEILEENGIDLAEMKILRGEMEKLGIDSNICKPGQYNHLSCPMVFDLNSESLSIVPILLQAYVNGNSTSGRITHIPKVKQTREITEKSLDLEPTCNEDWLGSATNWAKFSATAGLGVIHRGHLQQGRSLMAPYLPQSGAGGGGSLYFEGSSLYALGLIHANHGKACEALGRAALVMDA
ncbi:hypothetical protein HYC85_029262 [Camellia sinensis]|uniref:Uncharacterized protein n=1 Tax=Camellia sinensis TaxID=4442 RepID=A0A7J7FYQ8_CAMSI|nr:hypothetical protein HYC85_029262 [Camellia sinensis]